MRLCVFAILVYCYTTLHATPTRTCHSSINFEETKVPHQANCLAAIALTHQSLVYLSQAGHLVATVIVHLMLHLHFNLH